MFDVPRRGIEPATAAHSRGPSSVPHGDPPLAESGLHSDGIHTRATDQPSPYQCTTSFDPADRTYRLDPESGTAGSRRIRINQCQARL